MLRGTGRFVVGIAGLLLLATGCGASEQRATGNGGADPEGGAVSDTVPVGELIDGAPLLDADAKAALTPVSIDAADPQFPVENVDQFDAIVVGRVQSLTAGPVLPVFEGDKEPIESVMVKLEVTDALAGNVKDGGTVYVRLATQDLNALTRALPSGTAAFLAVSKVDESMDKYYDDPYAGVPEGATRYIAGAPYAAFADGEQRTWFPVLQEEFKQPLSALVPQELSKGQG